MGNSYFRFKQFTIQQDKSAMKVCTDASLFGAWLSAKLDNSLLHPQTILDIGTGTGLLSLMLAQTTSSMIDAIEIDRDAFEQASENISNSQWKNRIHLFHTDARKFDSEKKYDLIVSNPPFFENDLSSPEEKKNMAKHSSTLTLQELLEIVEKIIHPKGSLSILLPAHRSQQFKQMAAVKNFHLLYEAMVRQTPKHDFFRCMFIFSKQAFEKIAEEEIVIQQYGKNTQHFAELMKEYYL
jgi:tRNA1Val (adenine37-N6)-methyltransferase